MSADTKEYKDLYDRLKAHFEGFALKPIQKSHFEQFNDYAAKLPYDVRKQMCTPKLDVCYGNGECVTDMNRPLGFYCKCKPGYFRFDCGAGK